MYYKTTTTKEQLNKAVAFLNNYYTRKYNGETNLGSIKEGLKKSANIDYVDGRYLLIDGEKIRLDTFCNSMGVCSNYIVSKEHKTTANNVHTLSAKLPKTKGSKKSIVSIKESARNTILSALNSFYVSDNTRTLCIEFLNNLNNWSSTYFARLKERRREEAIEEERRREEEEKRREEEEKRREEQIKTLELTPATMHAQIVNAWRVAGTLLIDPSKYGVIESTKKSANKSAKKSAKK